MLRIDNEKEFMRIKINLEIEIQNCEKCYEDMKALYQLNSEKLKYNKEVLEDKQSENTKLKNDLKDKYTKYREQSKRKDKEYQDKYNDLNQKNKKLTKQYISISKQYKDLHKKFKHFVQTDTEKYVEVKKMNEEEVSKMKARIINCDRIIHQHQLGIVWEHINEEEVLIEDLGEAERALVIARRGNNQEEEEEEDDVDEGVLERQIPDLEMQAIVNLVLIELDFLLDDKVGYEAEREEGKEKLLIKLNVLRKVLAIRDDAEMNSLFMRIYYDGKKREERDEDGSVFSKENREEGDLEVDEYGEGEEEVGEEEDLDAIERKYDPNSIIKILSGFIEEKKKNVVLNNEDADVQTKNIIKQRGKDLSTKEKRIELERMSKVLPGERLKMWGVLDKISSQYYRLLLDRQKDIEETTQLHTQNDELKNLLNQYLKVNHNLLIPPTEMLKVNFLE